MNSLRTKFAPFSICFALGVGTGVPHLLLLACLLFLPFHAVSGKGVLAPEVVPFDRYGRIDWDDEKPRLDKFAAELKNKPESIAYIYVQVAQISCWGEGLSHAIGRTRYLIQTHNLLWNRVAWRDLGYGESFEVSLWLFPAGQPPLYVPEYKPETSSTFIEDCEMNDSLATPEAS